MKYYSELTEKLYDTEEELVNAEAAKQAEISAEELKHQKMVEEIADIEQQYEDLAEVRRAANERVRELIRTYGTEAMRYIRRNDVLYDCSTIVFYG